MRWWCVPTWHFRYTRPAEWIRVRVDAGRLELVRRRPGKVIQKDHYPTREGRPIPFPGEHGKRKEALAENLAGPECGASRGAQPGKGEMAALANVRSWPR